MVPINCPPRDPRGDSLCYARTCSAEEGPFDINISQFLYLKPYFGIDSLRVLILEDGMFRKIGFGDVEDLLKIYYD